ncbi:MAG TPA: hypothetical protein VIV07_00130 [Sphingomicrobium sp.]
MKLGAIPRLIVALLLLLVFSIPHSAAVAQPTLVVLGGDADQVSISGNEVRHKAANFLFPEQIGDMPLRKVTIYGSADASVDYTLRGGGNGDAWITFYVYPAQHALAEEVATIQSDLIGAWSATRLPSATALPPSAADGRSGWFKGQYEGKSATTGYIVVQRGHGFLMARYTIPDVAGQEGIERTIRALNAAPWNWTPAPRSSA